ncbi:unnamed protein product [Vicia faba]|uniref:Uncharacterized protein n=1 Tax=Vicia faba TaxID=3906 RepID=A0AAV0ZYA9_VICFA|nr:unnamed protein product [Vicia faba]
MKYHSQTRHNHLRKRNNNHDIKKRIQTVKVVRRQGISSAESHNGCDVLPSRVLLLLDSIFVLILMMMVSYLLWLLLIHNTFKKKDLHLAHKVLDISSKPTILSYFTFRSRFFDSVLVRFGCAGINALNLQFSYGRSWCSWSCGSL